MKNVGKELESAIMNIMKKIFAVIAVVFCLASAQAANDDVFACCSTVGPDYYADGQTLVADGEVYALVYTKKGATFAGFQADGSLVDATASEVVMLLPQAKGGRCQPTLCIVPKAYSTSRRTGVWELYVLDTRRADGTPAGVDENGALTRVRTWGRTAATVRIGSDVYSTQPAAIADGPVARGPSHSVVASELSALPADVSAPTITGIEVRDGRVTLNVGGTRPYLTYDVMGSAELGSETERVSLDKRDGDATRDIAIEADGSRARFFRVFIDRWGR